MKILAIDTSSKICSVAILEDNNIILEKHINDENTHSQKLMPLIDTLFKETKLTLDDINLLSCSVGPGSFTGIRIGVATIKAFSDVKSIPVVGINSLESLAYNIDNNGYIASLIDAKNDNVYFGLYKKEDNTYILSSELKADNINNIIPLLKEIKEPITFIGDGALAFKELLQNEFFNSIFVQENLNYTNSINVGKAAYNYFIKGKYGDSNTISPLYLRKSQAERALEEK